MCLIFVFFCLENMFMFKLWGLVNFVWFGKGIWEFLKFRINVELKGYDVYGIVMCMMCIVCM